MYKRDDLIDFLLTEVIIHCDNSKVNRLLNKLDSIMLFEMVNFESIVESKGFDYYRKLKGFYINKILDNEE